MVIKARETEVQAGYKLTEVGVIPEGWDVKPIGESFEICNHLRYPISQDTRKKMAGEYPYYGPTRVQDYINEYRVEGEYALIGEDGDHFLKWQDSPMTLLVNGKFNVNNHAHLVRGTKNLTRWFYYYFQNKDLTPYLTRQGAGRYKLTKNTLITIPCPIPPLPEQHAIATTLSDVDALIASLNKLIAKKRDIKQATMQQLLTGKMRLPGFSGEWSPRLLSEVCWFQEGPGVRNTQFTRSGVKLLNGTNIYRGEVNLDSTDRFISEKEAFGPYAHFLVDHGDILIACSGITIDKFHEKVAFAKKEHLPLCMNTSTMRFKPLKDYLLASFLYQLLMSDAFKKQISSQATGSAQLNFGPSHVANIVFVLPGLKEQQAIATVLSDMDAEIAALEQKRDKTRALKQGMMQELLTGKTRLL